MIKSTVTYPDRSVYLSPEDKQTLRDMMFSEPYLKLVRLVASRKPSAFAEELLSASQDRAPMASLIKLSEMRGWEMHEAALFSAIETKAPKRQSVEPTYPTSE